MDSQPGPPCVILFVEDLFFSARLADAVARAGGQPVTVESAADFRDAMDTRLPVLSLVDLHVPASWGDAIRRCKHLPHTRAVPVIGFGQHTDVETLKAARAAGMDQAWARSRLVKELPRVLPAHIAPLRPMPDGGTEDLPALAREGVDLFNKREFHAQHEAFEDAWNAESRPVRGLYQGLLQVGLAFLQIERRNQAGAFKMFGRGVPRLRMLPQVVQQVRVEEFLGESLSVHELLRTLDPSSDWQSLQDRLPRILLTNAA